MIKMGCEGIQGWKVHQFRLRQAVAWRGKQGERWDVLGSVALQVIR